MTKQNQTKAIKPPDEIDYLIAQVIMDDPSVTDQYMCDEVFKGKISRLNINKRRRSPQVQNIVAEPIKHVRDYIIKKKLAAARKIAKHINSPDDRISLKASEDFLRSELDPELIGTEDSIKAVFFIPKRHE
jgi:hypothetical protein